ncbi:MAG: tetratricopeptide repeat protein [Planctomycetota bacterium]
MWTAVCLIVVHAALLLSAELPGTQRTADERFLSGLRQRRLFQLAESCCTERLADPQLSESRRAQWVVELSLSLAGWAVHSPPENREPLWRRATQVTDDFAREFPESPRLPLVRLQGALAVLARGELAREEAELAGAEGQRLADARASLKTAIRLLEDLDREIDEALRERSRPGRLGSRGSGPDELTSDQLASLKQHIRYQLARAYRNQGQCFAAASADRANSLTLAADLLDPLARLEVDHPLAWNSRIDEIACRRLLGDHTTAQRKLEALMSLSPSPSIALRGQAERLRLALAAGRLSEAVRMLAEGRQIEGATSPHLDYAILETTLAAWQAAGQSGDDGRAAEWQAKANDLVRLIRRLHGPYWTRRAQMLLSGYVRDVPGGDLDMWIQTAEDAYHSQRHDDALAAYDRAVSLAQKQGDPGRAFDLGFVAATIEHHRGRHPQAMSRYRRLALDMPSQPKAPQAHVLALYHAGQMAKSQEEGSLEPYVAIAEEHLKNWPAASTADEVCWCLAHVWEHQGEWQKAVGQFQAISPEYERFVEVVGAVEDGYEAWLDQLRVGGQPTAEVASEAAAWFESLVLGPENQLPEQWSPLERTAALTAARFRLDDSAVDLDRARWIVSAALDASDDASPPWRSAARCLLVSSLARQGRYDEASDVLRQISEGSPQELLDMLEGLSSIAAPGGDSRASLAELQLGAASLLDARREQLSPTARRDLDRARAEALALAGRSDEAREAYRRLSEAHPRDGEIQEGYARLLLGGKDPRSLQTALAKWREIAGRSTRGSDRWFRAKFAVALLHERSKNHEQAEKVIRLLQVVYRDRPLGDREVTARFLELLDPEDRRRFLDLVDRCR